ncbi:MAG: hypothetical protein PHP62_04865 [Candidatus Moranbacteria bacterium]|nr:hypothetical protein [Candidatus Moranbacteria bacterium]
MAIKEGSYYFFVLGDLWGPIGCDYPGCGDVEDGYVRLSEGEYEKLAFKSGPEAAQQICREMLGKCVCKDHRFSEEI